MVEINHEAFMRGALDQAQIALKEGEVPVGCIIVHKPTGIVIGHGGNTTNKEKNATKHCEFNAIEEIKQNYHNICVNKLSLQQPPSDIKQLFNDCSLYVTVEPCIMCGFAIKLMGIQDVFYGCGNSKFGGNGSILNLHQGGIHEYEATSGILEEEAIEVLQTFFAAGNINAPEFKRKRELKPDDREDDNQDQGK
mmetsp:Transcript_27068/g.31223  ORF Transcript_27068/g.31223 Transcript_27068/m.31223 type:complete len:194 (+) Transcript_27068:1284-1865(+)